MNYFRANQTVEIGEGTIALTDAQAGPRRRKLMKVKDGVYQVRELVQFKAGEVVGIVGDVPKHLVHKVDPVDADGNSPEPEEDFEPAPAPKKKPGPKRKPRTGDAE